MTSKITFIIKLKSKLNLLYNKKVKYYLKKDYKNKIATNIRVKSFIDLDEVLM